MKLYTHPRSLSRSTDYSLRMNGHPVETLFTGVADFAIVALEASDFPVQIEVQTRQTPRDLVVRPLALRVKPEFDATKSLIRFTLDCPAAVSIDPGYGLKPLYLFANEPEKAPAPGTPGVITLPAGQITENFTLTLDDNQTLYLPGGSVLKGRVHVRGKRNVRICGHGIIDGSFFAPHSPEVPHGLVTLEGCHRARLEEVMLVRPFTWTVVLVGSEDVSVQNVRSIGEMVAGDGIDVVGSRRVVIEDCFLHHNDDCVAVKALLLNRDKPKELQLDGRQPVEDVRVERCTLANWHAGNAMEIGHELCTDSIRGITFRDIDVLHVHGTGAVFSIHNVDRALVSEVLWEKIRIEHCYDKLIDFRVTQSRYSTEVGDKAGIRGVVLRDIDWNRTPFNAGYTTSLIGGRTAAQPVEDVLIERFYVDGQLVRDLDQLEIHTRHCSGLRLLP
ncbi:MAG: hypothetical protein OHK005_12440 [Candidatus Methylacidiphilales bacterium]